MIVPTLGVFKYKGSKKERNYLLVITILAILLFSVTVIAIAIDNYYPQILTQYKTIFLVLMAALFLSLAIVVLVNVICKYNKEHKSKKY
jgi:NADH:ubiquinone oxidoreductase subunit K